MGKNTAINTVRLVAPHYLNISGAMRLSLQTFITDPDVFSISQGPWIILSQVMCTGFYLFPFTSCVDTFLLLKKQNDQNTLEASDFPQFI